MPIISAEIMKIIDERARCDLRCVVMRWSNSKVLLRQEKMSIISVEYNENDRWKRNAKKKKTNKDRKERGEALVKGWELNDFVVRLS